MVIATPRQLRCRWRLTHAVDPGLTQAAWLQASPTLEPVAVSRGKVTWSNNGVVVFRSGLVGWSWFQIPLQELENA